MFTAAKIRTFRIYYPHTPYFLGFIHKKIMAAILTNNCHRTTINLSNFEI